MRRVILQLDPDQQQRVVDQIHLFEEDGVLHHDFPEIVDDFILDLHLALELQEVLVLESEGAELVVFVSFVVLGHLSVVLRALHVVCLDDLALAAVEDVLHQDQPVSPVHFLML